MGRQPNLTGSGLVRSLGGWDEVKRRRKAGDWGNSDERILGDSDFVQAALAAGQECLARNYSYRWDGWDFDRLVMRVSEVLKIDSVRVTQKGRYPDVVAARSLLCYWGHRELGISKVELARRLGLTQAAISQSVARGATISRAKQLRLAEEEQARGCS
jgi:putative transposase